VTEGRSRRPTRLTDLATPDLRTTEPVRRDARSQVDVRVLVFSGFDEADVADERLDRGRSPGSGHEPRGRWSARRPQPSMLYPVPRPLGRSRETPRRR
jgi:hypothetical protein